MYNFYCRHLGLKQGILEAVASGAFIQAVDVYKLMTTTLYATQQNEQIQVEYEEALTYLQEQLLLEASSDGKLYATLLGQAIFGAGLSPVEGIRLHQVK
jgi:replicative superfamily II helicase